MAADPDDDDDGELRLSPDADADARQRSASSPCLCIAEMPSTFVSEPNVSAGAARVDNTPSNVASAPQTSTHPTVCNRANLTVVAPGASRRIFPKLFGGVFSPSAAAAGLDDDADGSVWPSALSRTGSLPDVSSPLNDTALFSPDADAAAAGLRRASSPRLAEMSSTFVSEPNMPARAAPVDSTPSNVGSGPQKSARARNRANRMAVASVTSSSRRIFPKLFGGALSSPINRVDSVPAFNKKKFSAAPGKPCPPPRRVLWAPLQYLNDAVGVGLRTPSYPLISMSAIAHLSALSPRHSDSEPHPATSQLRKRPGHA